MASSVIMICLTALFGGILVVAAFRMKQLVAWENRLLNSWADAVQRRRIGLEEELGLLAQVPAAAPQLQVVRPARQRKKDRAA